jgi:hypothetical protein
MKLILKQLILYSDWRGVRMVRHAVHGGGNEKLVQDFDKETEGKSPTGKTRYIWEDNINSNLKVL